MCGFSQRTACYISEHTGLQIVVRAGHSCNAWNLIWEGQWLNTTQHTFSVTLKMHQICECHCIRVWRGHLKRLVIQGGVKLSGEVITSPTGGAQFVLLVLFDKAYLPHTQGSIYCSGLMTCGCGSVWIWVQSYTGKAKPLRALTLLLSRDWLACITGYNKLRDFTFRLTSENLTHFHWLCGCSDV